MKPTLEIDILEQTQPLEETQEVAKELGSRSTPTSCGKDSLSSTCVKDLSSDIPSELQGPQHPESLPSSDLSSLQSSFFESIQRNEIDTQMLKDIIVDGMSGTGDSEMLGQPEKLSFDGGITEWRGIFVLCISSGQIWSRRSFRMDRRKAKSQ